VQQCRFAEGLWQDRAAMNARSMKAAKCERESSQRIKPGTARAWFRQYFAFTHDPVRAAAEDKMDADWRAAVGRAQARVEAEWTGDPDDFVGKLVALTPHIPPLPPGFQERRRRCNRCGFPTQRHPDSHALFCSRCNRWIGPGCGCLNCELCSKRSESPAP
jgi:hypothetical protein